MKENIEKKIIIFLFFIFTVLIGAFYGENSSGGAKHDHLILINYIQHFSEGISEGIKKFLASDASKIHSPVFYIIISIFLNFFDSLLPIKVIYIFISSLIPYIFYLILKNKYKSGSLYFFLFSLVIFFSPYFRTSAIWILGDNLALIFFGLFVFYISNTLENEKNINLYYLASVFIILASYIRYYYCIYYLLILFFLFKNFNKKPYIIIKVLTFSFCLSIPAVIYFLKIILNYKFLNTLSIFGYLNYLNVAFNIYLILLFYLILIIFVNYKDFYNYYKKKKIFLINITVAIFILYNLDYFFFNFLDHVSNSGGGIIKKIFQITIGNYFLFIPLIFSVLCIDYIFKEKRKFNYFILFLIILSLPLKVTYQKYLDPLIFFVFFGLIESDYLKKIMIDKKLKISLMYLYFFVFLVIANFYYSSYKIL